MPIPMPIPVLEYPFRFQIGSDIGIGIVLFAAARQWQGAIPGIAMLVLHIIDNTGKLLDRIMSLVVDFVKCILNDITSALAVALCKYRKLRGRTAKKKK